MLTFTAQVITVGKKLSALQSQTNFSLHFSLNDLMSIAEKMSTEALVYIYIYTDYI